MAYIDRLKDEIRHHIDQNGSATEGELMSLPVAQEAKLPWLVVLQALHDLRSEGFYNERREG